jgi:hypothetical protein
MSVTHAQPSAASAIWGSATTALAQPSSSTATFSPSAKSPRTQVKPAPHTPVSDPQLATLHHSGAQAPNLGAALRAYAGRARSGS